MSDQGYEQNELVNFTENTNFVYESGIVLSGMLVCDSTGEKIIVKVADQSPARAVEKLEETIQLLVDTGLYTRWADFAAERDAKQKVADEERKEQRSWQKSERREEPFGGNQDANEGSVLVKQIKYVKKKDGGQACVVECFDDFTFWINRDFAERYGGFAKQFPKDVGVFAEDNFCLDDGENKTLYNIEDGEGELVAHWKKNQGKNGKWYTNLVRVEHA